MISFGARCLSLHCRNLRQFAMFAFKEWTLVCDALARGSQSLIIRKGGIAEGRDGFRFKHPEFLLFPTLFHEQAAKLRVPTDTPLPSARTDEQHEIRLLARAEWTRDVTDWGKVQALEPFHLWSEGEIEKRFRQDDQPGVSVAFVRVFALSEPLVFPDLPKYGGCRSWIEVPDVPADTTVTPVIDDAAHREREAALRAIVD
jgi:hypothetical protein